MLFQTTIQIGREADIETAVGKTSQDINAVWKRLGHFLIILFIGNWRPEVEPRRLGTLQGSHAVCPDRGAHRDSTVVIGALK